MEKVEYKFILNSENSSLAKVKIELENNSVINVIAYNQTADYCYRNLNINDLVFVHGRVHTGLEILAEKIIKLEGGVKYGK